MAEITINDLRQGYLDMLRFVEAEGEVVSPRGMRTKEVRNATIVLTDPTKAIPVGVGRKLNMKIGAVETTQLIAGVSSAMQLNVTSNNAFEKYMNDGRLKGAYGPRVYSQLENVIRMISRDHDTRQAAALVWRGNETTLALEGNLDVPCTVALSWNVRGGKLNASTVMRSNDVFLGVAYDFWMFTRLQMTLAWALGLELGDYRHHAVSLHIYERDWGKVDGLTLADDEPVLPGGYTSDAASAAATEEDAVSRWKLARESALDVVFGEKPDTLMSGANWYYDTLKDHGADGELCDTCRYFYDDSDVKLVRLHNSGQCIKTLS